MTSLTACSFQHWTSAKLNNEPTQTIQVCINITSEYNAAAEAAVQDWQKSLINYYNITSVIGPSLYCDIHIDEVNQAFKDNPFALARTSRQGGHSIFLVKGRYESATKIIVLHELGHAFGAQHVNGTLMDYNYNKNMPSCPDFITVLQVAQWNHINLNMLMWCY